MHLCPNFIYYLWEPRKYYFQTPEENILHTLYQLSVQNTILVIAGCLLCSSHILGFSIINH